MPSHSGLRISPSSLKSSLNTSNKGFHNSGKCFRRPPLTYSRNERPSGRGGSRKHSPLFTHKPQTSSLSCLHHYHIWPERTALLDRSSLSSCSTRRMSNLSAGVI